MMSTKLRLKRAAMAGTFCVFAWLLHGDAQAADSVVPSEWNVAPMTNGAYREAFDTVLPTWAGAAGYNVVTSAFPTMTGSALPARSNLWFGTSVKAMQLETGGEVVSNTLAYAGAGGDVVFGSKPVYVDLRIRFDALIDSPDLSMLDNVKMAVFVSSDAKLVAAHAGGMITNSTPLDTNKWYQVTVKLFNNTFDVLMNDANVFTNLTLKSVGSANTLASASFYGTGWVDELYVSHGDPAYAIAGPTNAIPTLPTGGNQPTDEQQTMINVWLNGYPTVTVLSMTQDELNSCFLLNELGVSGNTGTPVEYTFGISAFDLVSPTVLVVTAALTIDSGTKDGTINGKIQLQGKVNIGDAWTTLPGAVTPTVADFTDGKATYTFTIPADGYKFFKPLIVP